MKLGEQKDRDEEAVQVHTPFVIEHDSSIELYCSGHVSQYLPTIVVGAFMAISRPSPHSCHLQYIGCLYHIRECFECMAHCIRCKYPVCTVFTAVSKAHSGE